MNDYIPARIYEIIISGLGAVVVYFLVRIHKQLDTVTKAVYDLRLTMAKEYVVKDEHRIEHEKEAALAESRLECRIAETINTKRRTV